MGNVKRFSTRTSVGCFAALTAVAVAFLLNARVVLGQACTYAEPTQDLATIQRDIKATCELVRPAIVKIEIEHLSPGSGTLITPDGHILTTARRAQDHRGKQIAVQLFDGRRMNAKPLGWSGEWNIGLLKISDDAPFPHVPLADEPVVPKPGRGCVAIGFPHDRQYTGTEPVVRFGSIALVCDPIWCTSTCPLWFDFGTGLFDLEGRLLGICTWVPTSSDPVFTLVAPVRDNWNELASGNNVDELRLFRNNAPIGASSVQDNVTQNGLRRANAASVRIVKNPRSMWSGVIVTEDGYIATCAHHRALPGEKVTVLLPDGRDVSAQVLGMNRVTDIGLVKIFADGPWPYTEMGDSTVMKIDMPATVMGFPGAYQKRSPLVRKARIVAKPGQESIVPSKWIHSYPESKLRGGDSGGGLFDAGGKLIGIHAMITPTSRDIRVEALRKQWEFLAAAKPVGQMETPNPFGPESTFLKATEKVKSAVVEVRCDGRRACLGFIVSSDGKIVTKNSELKGQVSCRLPVGDERQARVLRYSREHDLALLKIDATDLPVPEWSPVDHVVYTFVAAILPDTPRPWGKFPLRDSPLVGLVTQAARPILPQPGLLGKFNDTDRGLELYSLRRKSEQLEKNDIILSVEGHPTPDRESFRRVMQPSQATVLAYAGEPVEVKIRRDGKTLDLRCVLAETPSNSLQDESVRRSGFPSAVDSDISLAPTECGAPVIDAKGDVCGIVIASRGRGQTRVLTTSEVRRFLSER
ncbi:MAG: trypsin-like peptidase domain-containing protein [Planctomycetota bacterium]|jgi:serine protease Do